MKRFIGVLIILLILLLYIGYFFVTDDPNSSFADTALFVMALVGLLVTLTSIGIWTALKRILQDDIEKKISQAEEVTRNEALSRMAAKVANSFWECYEATQINIFLDQAISSIYDARKILEESAISEENEGLRCDLYNNLACAYAERGNSDDTTTAHFLANYIMEKAGGYPDDEVDWIETYAYVLYRLPKKQADKGKALGIINGLLERPDIKDATKLEYRKRYSIPNPKEVSPSKPHKSSP